MTYDKGFDDLDNPDYGVFPLVLPFATSVEMRDEFIRAIKFRIATLENEGNRLQYDCSFWFFGGKRRTNVIVSKLAELEIVLTYLQRIMLPRSGVV